MRVTFMFEHPDSGDDWEWVQDLEPALVPVAGDAVHLERKDGFPEAMPGQQTIALRVVGRGLFLFGPGSPYAKVSVELIHPKFDMPAARER